MASAFVTETFEKLRKQVESLGLDEKQKNKFLEEWKRLCGAEERRTIREAEERKAVLAVKAEEAQRKRDMEAEEAQRVREFELEKLRLQNKAKGLAVERQVEERHIDRRPVGDRVKLPELPSFTDGKDDLDSYLLRFERYATVAEWNRDSWATHLSALLSGNALDVYSRLSQEKALCYNRLKTALLNRYNYTEHGYKQRFRETKPEGFETPGQFIVRLKNYLCKWIDLSEVTKSFEGVVHFNGAGAVRQCLFHRTICVFNGKKAQDNRRTSRHSRIEDGRPKELRGAGVADLRCFTCQGCGHKAADCRVRATGSRRTWEANRGWKYCQRCLESGHDATDCRARLRGQGLQFPDGGARSKPPVHHVGCGILVRDSTRIPEDGGPIELQNKLENYQSSSNEEQWLELRDGSKVEILNAACVDKVDKNQMPVVPGLVGQTPVEVLRDTGCSGVIVKKALVKEQQLTGAVGYIMTIDRRALKLSIAIIDIDTPYFAGKTEAMCMSDLIFELIVGNIPGARAANDENKEWCVPAAVVIRARAKQETRSRSLLVASLADELPVTKNQLMQLQEQDMPSVDDDALLELGTHLQKENVTDVKLGPELSATQFNELKASLDQFAEVFSDMPGKTDVIEHEIELIDENPVRSRPYPLSYAVRQNLKEEIDQMLNLGIIRPSTSAYASPIVIVRKRTALIEYVWTIEN